MILFSCYLCAAAYYNLAQFLNDQSMVQIRFNAPPTIITTNISMYINFPRVNDYIRWYGNENSTVVARLSVVSSYSGIDLPVNNTIVTLTAPNGTESMTVDILLNINESHIERCYDSFLNESHTLVNVPVNIHSPLMYTQLGEYNFTITLDLISLDSSSLNDQLEDIIDDAYTFTVNITNNGESSILIGNCDIMTFMIGIIEEPSTPTKIVPNFTQDNTFNFTITTLDITVRIIILHRHYYNFFSSSRQDNSCSELQQPWSSMSTVPSTCVP